MSPSRFIVFISWYFWDFWDIYVSEISVKRGRERKKEKEKEKERARERTLARWSCTKGFIFPIMVLPVYNSQFNTMNQMNSPNLMHIKATNKSNPWNLLVAGTAAANTTQERIRRITRSLERGLFSMISNMISNSEKREEQGFVRWWPREAPRGSFYGGARLPLLNKISTKEYTQPFHLHYNKHI